MVFSALTAALGAGTAAASTGASVGAAAAGAAGAAGSGAGALTGIAGLVGTGVSVAGQMMQMGAAKDATEASKKQESLRKTQMEIENKRNIRNTIRTAMIAKADAVSNAASQGVSDSSGLAGGIGGINATRGVGIADANTNIQLGRNMFKAKSAEADALGRQATGQGISSLGGAIVSMQDQIGQLGTYYTS